jgi:cation diffusion facilitator CzcD-associated flavoprotein CzcO
VSEESPATRAGLDHNVVIVGAGHSGLGIGYGLKRKGVGSAVIIDQADPGPAGIWRSIARMVQLRTPKTLTGPERGLRAGAAFRRAAPGGPAGGPRLRRRDRV